MQNKPTGRIRDVFGWNGFPDALFYEANYALRFELGGEVHSKPLRFLRAMDRAREVASTIFEQSLNLTAIVCDYDGERRSSRAVSSFKSLAKIGFQADFSKPERIPLNDQDYIAEFGEDLCAYWCSAEIGRSREDRDALLWVCNSREIGISPTAKGIGKIYIVDFDAGIVLHVYDDRGMDLVALDPGKLRPVYHMFNEWLLDYNREKMDETFTSRDTSDG